MRHRLALVISLLAPLLVAAVSAPPPAAADGPNLCVNGSKWKKSAAVKFTPGDDRFSMSIDNRGNDQVQVETWDVTASRTTTKASKYSGEVSTKIKTRLAFLAEGEVDVKLGAERSTQKSVTATVTTKSERRYPANTWGTWTRGIWVVKSTAIHKCYKPSHKVWVTVATARRSWPVMNGWKWTLIAKG
jgi:hypothetical protein